MKKIILIVAALSIVFGTVSLAAVWARGVLRASVASAAILRQNRVSSDEQIETFTGSISKSGDQYVLQSPFATAPYQLDDQQIASRFTGKRVTVTGTLDATDDLIHVQDIQEASS
ncbi:MAG: DUF5818 domain-containing protein [Candidatus Acidiferrales bacterium]